MKFSSIIIFISVILISCAPKVQRKSKNNFTNSNSTSDSKVEKITNHFDKPIIEKLKTTAYQWIATPNFNERMPSFVVIHHTAQDSIGQTIRTFTDTARKVSAHFVIARDGRIYQMLSEYFRAWHAGKSSWGNVTDINSSSIGIELDNNGNEPFGETQMKSLLFLLRNIKDSFKIPTQNFIGHADIAPGRKIDPSKYFSWKKLADSGFGRWYTDTSKIIVPQNFNTLHALRIIGYDISSPKAAMQAFRIHFMQSDSQAEFTKNEKKIVYSLMLQYL